MSNTATAKRAIRAEATKRIARAVSVGTAPKQKARAKAPALPAFTPYVAPVEPTTFLQGQWPLLALRRCQCRYSTGRDAKRSALFCGEPSPISPGKSHGSWCETHRSVVFQGGRIEGERQ